MGNICSEPQGQDIGLESAHKNISVAEFLSVCIFLSEECGKIIRQVADSGDLKTQEKGKDGPVTIADLRVQKTLEVCLRSIYPTLRIQGEESAKSLENVEPAVQPSAITKNIKKFISSDFLEEKHSERRDWILNTMRQYYSEDEISAKSFETFNTRNSVVWIDPVDGTSDFVKGNLPAVTVLIGLSIDGKSRAGIVHNPFTEEDQSVGKTVFGTAEHGCYRVDTNKADTVEQSLARPLHYMAPFDNEARSEDHKIRVAASLSHFSDTIKKVIETLEPVEIKRIGGAGNKCTNLAYDTVDAYIHPSPGLMFWDLCAPESLVKAMGGWSTNLYQERLTYPVDAPNYKIKGLILTKNPPMYNMVKSRMGDFLTNISETVKL